MKRIPSTTPDTLSPSAGLSFLQALLGFVLGCVLVLAVMGCLEFRRVALKAQADAAEAEAHTAALQGDVENLKAWAVTFQDAIETLKTAVGVSQAAEYKARDKNADNISKTP